MEFGLSSPDLRPGAILRPSKTNFIINETVESLKRRRFTPPDPLADGLLIFFRKTDPDLREQLLGARNPVSDLRKPPVGFRINLAAARKPPTHSRKNALDAQKNHLHLRKNVGGYRKNVSDARKSASFIRNNMRFFPVKTPVLSSFWTVLPLKPSFPRFGHLFTHFPDECFAGDSTKAAQSAAVRIMSRVKYRIRPQFGQVMISACARQLVTTCAGSFMWQPPQALCSTPTTTFSPLLLNSRS